MQAWHQKRPLWCVLFTTPCSPVLAWISHFLTLKYSFEIGWINNQHVEWSGRSREWKQPGMKNEGIDISCSKWIGNRPKIEMLPGSLGWRKPLTTIHLMPWAFWGILFSIVYDICNPIINVYFESRLENAFLVWIFKCFQINSKCTLCFLFKVGSLFRYVWRRLPASIDVRTDFWREIIFVTSCDATRSWPWVFILVLFDLF